MGPKIDAHLVLADGGRTVKVVGPTGDWDRYAVSATFKVVVAQIQGANIVFAVGESDEPYTPDKTWWDADAEISSTEPGKFVEGWASAWGVASVRMRDDTYEPFAWGVDTRLIDITRRPPPPNYPPPWTAS